MRFILIFIALAVIAIAIKRLLRKPETADKQQLSRGKMVQCAHCGVYIPQADATKDDSKYYCSQAHRDAQQP